MTRLMKLPVPPTRINNHIFVYLTDGEATMNGGSETYRVLPGACLIVPAGQVFSFDKVEDNRGYLCSVHPDFIVGRFGTSALLSQFEFLRVWGNPLVGLDPPASGFVADLMERMLLDYSEHGLTGAPERQPDLIQAYFIALLCELNRAYKPISANGQTHAVAITNRFKELLFAHVKTRQLVADYASLLNITPQPPEQIRPGHHGPVANELD